MKIKKIASLAMALAMTATAVPPYVSAVDYESSAGRAVIADITGVETGSFDGLSYTLYQTEGYAVINGFADGITKDELIIPATIYDCPVRSIAKTAFKKTAVKKVVIPETVETICSNAFELCKELETVELPDTVTSIEGYAFSQCVKLTSAHIPAGLTKLSNSVF